MPRGAVAFRPASERPEPVRFAEGFEPFEHWVREQDADPADLARDVSELWAFVAAHPTLLDSPDLADAAAVFTGNAIAVVHPAATWRATDEPEIGTRTRSIPVAGLVRMMVEHPDRRRGRLSPSTGTVVTITATVEYVQVEAGALFELVVPGCSCDACDETAESEAGRLEEPLLAIAAGGLQERYPLGRRRWVHTRITYVDGGGIGSSGGPDPALTPAQLEGIAETLAPLPGGWLAGLVAPLH